MKTKEELQQIATEYEEAKQHFLFWYKPEFDRAYKQFVSDTSDRAKHLDKDKNGQIWQSNVFMPQIFSYIKTFLQKTVGVSPDFNIKGKNSEPLKEVIQWLFDQNMSEDMIDYFLQVFITGNSVGKDFLNQKSNKKREKEVGLIEQIKQLFIKSSAATTTFCPDFDPVDLYNWYAHPRMKKMSDNFRVFQRYVITLDEAKAQYPDVKQGVWAQFKDKQGGDTQDYAYVRKEVLLKAYSSLRETTTGSSMFSSGKGTTETPKSSEILFEIVEGWNDDELVVFAPMGGGDPIEIKSGENPYDYQDKPFRLTKFFPRPFQLLGMGIPKIEEQLQELLNSTTNQRQDAVSLGMHGMIAASPSSLPGYKSSDIKFGPREILWTQDPRSIQYVRQGEVPQSAYLEADKIKEAMRVAVGIDDYTTGVAGSDQKQTATVASFMREATLEGVKLFLIMLSKSYEGHFDHFIKLIQQYWTERSVVPAKALRILDDHSDIDFPTQEVSWIDQDGKHLLFPDEYDVTIEQSSTMATSTELAKAKDVEFWNMVKDMPDDMIDPETGEIYSIKKFKVLMKVVEDYGWEKDEYVVKKKMPEVGQIDPAMIDPNNPAPGAPLNINQPATQPLTGNTSGADLGAAMQ